MLSASTYAHTSNSREDKGKRRALVVSSMVSLIG
jgi:hypothetical protein